MADTDRVVMLFYQRYRYRHIVSLITNTNELNDIDSDNVYLLEATRCGAFRSLTLDSSSNLDNYSIMRAVE